MRAVGPLVNISCSIHASVLKLCIAKVYWLLFTWGLTLVESHLCLGCFPRSARKYNIFLVAVIFNRHAKSPETNRIGYILVKILQIRVKVTRAGAHSGRLLTASSSP